MEEAGIVENHKADNQLQIIGVLLVIMLGDLVVHRDKALKPQVMLGELKRKLLKPQIPQMDGEVQKQKRKQPVLGGLVKLNLMMLHNQHGDRASQQ